MSVRVRGNLSVQHNGEASTAISGSSVGGQSLREQLPRRLLCGVTGLPGPMCEFSIEAQLAILDVELSPTVMVPVPRWLSRISQRDASILRASVPPAAALSTLRLWMVLGNSAVAIEPSSC